MASKYDYDLFVIGAGSGGVRAARLAALSGARVGIAEEDRVGGTCVVRGCVPKKFMVYASEFSSLAKLAEGYGWSKTEATFDWPGFIRHKDTEIARLSGIYVTNLSKAGADLVHGRAVLKDAHTIEIKGEHAQTLTAEKILIAVGGWPIKPDIPGAEHAITSNEAFHLAELPKSIVIVGGGYIAVEFAGIFNGLGVETTLIYRGANILRGFDDDLQSGARLRAQEHREGRRRTTGLEAFERPRPRHRSGDVRHGPQPLCDRPRLGKRRGEAGRSRPYRGRQILAHQCREHLGGGRCDRPHQPDAGGDP